MQALVDHRSRFMDTNVGCTVSVHDARVFGDWELYLHGEAVTLFPLNDIVTNGITVPAVVHWHPALC